MFIHHLCLPTAEVEVESELQNTRLFIVLPLTMSTKTQPVSVLVQEEENDHRYPSLKDKCSSASVTRTIAHRIPPFVHQTIVYRPPFINPENEAVLIAIQCWGI